MTHLPELATAIVLCALGACSGSNSTEAVTGDLVVPIVRGGASLLPSQADSALFLVSDRSRGFELVKAVAIPPDASTNVTIPLPVSVGALYQLDVIA